MKKFFRTTAMMLALSMMLGISAMAAPTVNKVDAGATPVDVQDNKIGSVTYENDKIVAGGQYMIFVSTGNVPTQENLLYINQADTKTDGVVTFNNVYPKLMKTSKVLVSGTGLGGLQHILDLITRLFGDVDDNGMHTAYDALQIQRFAAGLESLITNETLTEWLNYVDVDGNGVITAYDALQIQRAAAGLDSALD